MMIQSADRMGVHPGSAIRVAPDPMMSISQKTMLSVESVRPRMRTVIAESAYPVAAKRTASPAKVVTPAPVGRSTIRTPARPTTIAAQRRHPTRSPRIGTANAVISRGATKKIE